MNTDKYPISDTTRMAATYPQPPPYAQPHGAAVVTSVPAVVVVGSNFADTPAVTVCPVCHQNITTRTERSAGLLTWLLCGGLAIVGCIAGCCLIPFCVDACQDVNHYCPNCNHHIYKHKRL
ncbi:LITAF domain-containing protein [Microcaecilia unicolor]|uniref:LITAF domain-containing protein-like n=1 Tax=Microcaecilia unicolor TaxID=1415580 RepID=A0A6P7YWH2_9AMPH|nr:LITAF domain-containing protein-like [Microcaecilia unicolor]